MCRGVRSLAILHLVRLIVGFICWCLGVDAVVERGIYDCDFVREGCGTVG